MKFIIQYCPQLSIGYTLAGDRERERESSEKEAIHIWDLLNRISHFVFGNVPTNFFGVIMVIVVAVVVVMAVAAGTHKCNNFDLDSETNTTNWTHGNTQSAETTDIKFKFIKGSRLYLLRSLSLCLLLTSNAALTNTTHFSTLYVRLLAIVGIHLRQVYVCIAKIELFIVHSLSSFKMPWTDFPR